MFIRIKFDIKSKSPAFLSKTVSTLITQEFVGVASYDLSVSTDVVTAISIVKVLNTINAGTIFTEYTILDRLMNEIIKSSGLVPSMPLRDSEFSIITVSDAIVEVDRLLGINTVQLDYDEALNTIGLGSSSAVYHAYKLMFPYQIAHGNHVEYLNNKLQRKIYANFTAIISDMTTHVSHENIKTKVKKLLKSAGYRYPDKNYKFDVLGMIDYELSLNAKNNAHKSTTIFIVNPISAIALIPYIVYAAKHFKLINDISVDFVESNAGFFNSTTRVSGYSKLFPEVLVYDTSANIIIDDQVSNATDIRDIVIDRNAIKIVINNQFDRIFNNVDMYNLSNTNYKVINTDECWANWSVYSLKRFLNKNVFSDSELKPAQIRKLYSNIGLDKYYEYPISSVIAAELTKGIRELIYTIETKIRPEYDGTVIDIDELINDINIVEFMVYLLCKNIDIEKSMLSRHMSTKAAEKLGFINDLPDNLNKVPLDNDLDSLIGLEDIKDQVHKLINYFAIKKYRSTKTKNTTEESLSMIFTGNPGTAKTTVAKFLGSELFKHGVLKTNSFVVATRADLCGKYIGYTAQMTNDMFASAKGGILFIDEAYALSDSEFKGDYGYEAINQLVNLMDENRDTMVIFAGYPKEMDNFINSNPGLASRIGFHLKFNNYTDDELIKILNKFATDNNYKIKEECYEYIKEIIDKNKDSKNFGNGRFMRNMFDKAIINQGNRLALECKMNFAALSDDQLNTLIPEDFHEVNVYQGEIKKSIGF